MKISILLIVIYKMLGLVTIIQLLIPIPIMIIRKNLGFFFVVKILYINNNININIKCCPNKMICKNCMEKNKKRYKLDKLDKSDDLVLININGRAAKKKKNGFKCYGHFLVEKLIEVCAKKFTCEACKLLNKYENYYICNN